MTLLLSITIGIVFAASVYLMLSRELKALSMGVFLIGHAANLAILAVSRSPLGGRPPVLGADGRIVGGEVDPLPQALILTAIVIGFAVQAFLLTMLVVTWRRTGSLDLEELARDPDAPADPFADDFAERPEGVQETPEPDTGPEEVAVRQSRTVGAFTP